MNIDMWLLEHITLEPDCLRMNACHPALNIREAKCGVSSTSWSAFTFPRLYGQNWSKWNEHKSWLNMELEYSGIWNADSPSNELHLKVISWQASWRFVQRGTSAWAVLAIHSQAEREDRDSWYELCHRLQKASQAQEGTLIHPWRE